MWLFCLLYICFFWGVFLCFYGVVCPVGSVRCLVCTELCTVLVIGESYREVEML
jgi:hypothetical protein